MKKRILSILVCLVMVLTTVNFAFAAEGDSLSTAVTNPFRSDVTFNAGGSMVTSNSYRIPAMVTLDDGTIVAAADVRWNTTYDGGGLDTLVARSTNGGATWSYTLANYLGDNGNEYNAKSTAFIDPALTVAADGKTVYMLCDLYSYGVALNGDGQQTAPEATKAFNEAGNLILHAKGVTAFSYYLKDGKIHRTSGEVVEGYDVDPYFNITYNNGESVSNLFCEDSPFHVARTGYLCLTKSTDGGKTWSAPTLLNLEKSSDLETVCLVGPGRGLTTADGTMVFPIYGKHQWYGNKLVFIYSKDGVEWKRVNSSISNSSEAAVVEIGEGTLRFFYRQESTSGTLCYIDYDMNAGTWGSAVNTGVKTNSNTQMSAITYSKTVDGNQVILVSCPTGPNAEGSSSSDGSNRLNGRIFAGVVAEDGTMTWTEAANVTGATAANQITGTNSVYTEEDGFFAYSCLTERADGSVAILYENEQHGWGAGSDKYFTMNMKAYESAELGLEFDGDDDELVHRTVTGEVNGIIVSVTGKMPKRVNLSLSGVNNSDIDLIEYNIENVQDILTAMDIKLVQPNGDEWQPVEPVTVTMDLNVLNIEDGEEVTVKHNHKWNTSSLGEFAVEDGKIAFETDGFSIYVVTISTNDWNRNNYAIMLSVGDEQEVSVTQNNSSSWKSSDTSVLRVENTTSQTATITGVKPGKVTLSKGTQHSIEVTVVEKAGNEISDDIIFKNIKVPYSNSSETQITEYANTYGPYVMKVRFEDSAGNLIDVDQDYFVFDSAVPININTFAVAAPEGYTYDGAYFFWNGHTGDNADRIYVTKVTRLSTLGRGGSYLYFDHGTTVNDWYQASGVLHIVYVKKDQSYSVTFEDHEGTLLHSYAVKYKDSDPKIPSSYVQNLEATLLNGIEENHNIAAPGYEFTDTWNVTSDSGDISHKGITTKRLVELVPTWSIRTNVKVTAICSEADATINYRAVTESGGTVSRAAETVKAINGTVQGSVAQAEDGYEFKGWYSDASCSPDTKVSDDLTFVPAKVNGVNVSATYYAKFEEKTATINYVAIGPDGNVATSDIGTVTPTSEGPFGVITVKPKGSTAQVGSDLYKFVGWYSDRQCTNRVSTDANFVPTATYLWPYDADELTFYAKFELNAFDLQIKKVINKTADEDQIFMFNIDGSGFNQNSTSAKAINTTITVKVPANSTEATTTIKVLPAGQYRIVELTDWSWRYNLNSATFKGNPINNNSIVVNGDTNNVAIYTNNYVIDTWLDGSAYADNVFGDK